MTTILFCDMKVLFQMIRRALLCVVMSLVEHLTIHHGMNPIDQVSLSLIHESPAFHFFDCDLSASGLLLHFVPGTAFGSDRNVPPVTLTAQLSAQGTD